MPGFDESRLFLWEYALHHICNESQYNRGASRNKKRLMKKGDSIHETLIALAW
jgi:hypothetical protein